MGDERRNWVLMEGRIFFFSCEVLRFYLVRRDDCGTASVVERRPILVAVYGWSDSGKSFFIKRVGDHFGAQGLRCSKYNSAPFLLDFDIIKGTADYPDKCTQLYLFHCGWVGDNLRTEFYRQLFGNENPDLLAKTFLGRGLDLGVLIYNPNRETLSEKIAQHYDLVISNPGAGKKVS